jgi:hypothetical protein
LKGLHPMSALPTKADMDGYSPADQKIKSG